MRFLLDENMPSTLARELRALGHDVLCVVDFGQGADDVSVLAKAQEGERVLLTLDKDFGELAFRSPLPSSCGIVLFRLSGTDPQADISQMMRILTSRNDWAGQFTVATKDRVRQRGLLGGSERK